MRLIALVCALCMIISGTLTDLIGVALLAVLATAWVLILAYALGRWLRDKRKKNPPA